MVLDCAHGATYKVAPHVFEELGAKVTSLSVTPDGTNINRKCGALHPELMAETVRKEGADIGLAFDGDGDRIGAVDCGGEIIWGDQLLAILSQVQISLIQKEKLFVHLLPLMNHILQNNYHSQDQHLFFER